MKKKEKPISKQDLIDLEAKLLKRMEQNKYNILEDFREVYSDIKVQWEMRGMVEANRLGLKGFEVAVFKTLNNKPIENKLFTFAGEHPELAIYNAKRAVEAVERDLASERQAIKDLLTGKPCIKEHDGSRPILIAVICALMVITVIFGYCYLLMPKFRDQADKLIPCKIEKDINHEIHQL